MKISYALSSLVIGMGALVGCASVTSEDRENTLAVAEVKADMKRVADWQIEHFGEVYDTKHRKRAYELGEWTVGALYVGMSKWAEIAGDDTYYDWLLNVGEDQDWILRQERFYHADDHCVGQLYLDLYKKYKKPEMIAPTIEQFEKIMAEPSTNTLVWVSHSKSTERWAWCDALFMAPPVWAKLSSATGDPKYRDWMFDEFKATTEYLFDTEENLYFRDGRFFEQRGETGNKIFWSRGNGWVFGGLALIMPEIPKDSEQYSYYADIFKLMAGKLKELQMDSGYWPMSLLEGELYTTPETSGTGFFCFGLAWGINNGILDRATYEPVVMKAWDALTRAITEDNMLGYVQPIGAEPGQAWPDRTEVYGTGAFLAAGAEVTRMIED